MCGIVGVIGKAKMGLTQLDQKVFEQMLLVDQIRGQDGTGIFYNNKRGNSGISTLKGAVDSTKFTASKDFSKAMDDAYKNANFIIGHNRASTRGGNTNKNTHPFREKHITLIHNGTLNTQKELHATVEVDSHAICHSIAEEGAIETLKKINGAFALVWFDSKQGRLFFCRNWQRPLHVVETANSFYIASEPEMVEWLLKRNNGPKIIQQYEVKPLELHSVGVHDTSNIKKETVEYKKFTSSYSGSQSSFYPTDHTKPLAKVPALSGKGVGDKITQFPPTFPFYSKGDAVLFRPVQLVNTTADKSYILGDIYTTKLHINKKDRVKDLDYEKKNRLRIYGKYNELVDLWTKPHLMTRIQQCNFATDGIYYESYARLCEEEPDVFPDNKKSNVVDINSANKKEDLPEPVEVDGNKAEGSTNERCSCCDGSFSPDDLTTIEDYRVCSDCALVLGAAVSNVWH